MSYMRQPNVYVVGTSSKTPFKLPEDENSTEPLSEGKLISLLEGGIGLIKKCTVSLAPQLERGALKVIEPKSWSIIDR